MKQKLKTIIKRIIAEELQNEGKGYLRGAALAGLLALGAGKMAGGAKPDSTTQTQQIDTVNSLAEFAVNNLGNDIDGMSQEEMLVGNKLEDIKNFQGNDESLFEELRVLAVRLQRAHIDSANADEYLERYFKLKTRR
jgi:hypothetical protein